MSREWRIRLTWMLFYEALTLPLAVLVCFVNRRIHPAYGLTWRKRIGLALRIFWYWYRVPSLITYKAQLMMAVKLFEVPPEVPGVVVECGCYAGGTTAALSWACALTGRQLIVYDSFEGMPPPQPGETLAQDAFTGGLSVPLETVQANVARAGHLEVCTFRKGWFADTVPQHREPIVLALFDVDYEASLDTCVRHLWPHLVQGGYLFVDEYLLLDFCALFFSERYWQRHFGEHPPGLMGAGTGVGLGQYYWGPIFEEPLLQHGRSIAYTWKGNSGYWRYDPDAAATNAGPPSVTPDVTADHPADPAIDAAAG